jgi:DNA/RNA-binding domain of Phe-tRNA-synthetase-like protein
LFEQAASLRKNAQYSAPHKYFLSEIKMLSILATDEWRNAHPGAIIGVLEMSRVENILPSPRLDEEKRATEARLRERYQGFTRPDFLSLPVILAYETYYKRFNKTYHVQLQVESIVMKGKNLPEVSPLVDSNFIAEVETLILTAGHDVAKLHGTVSIDVSREGDLMTQMNGTSKAIRAGDMLMKDADGICCSILYGQDNRSPISLETSHVLYVSYAPAGVPADVVDLQLQRIKENIDLFSPNAVVEQQGRIE